MEFIPLEIEGVFGILSESKSDSRGSLTRAWDSTSILKSFNLIQSSIVTNPRMGTLRGLHFQTDPFSENKVVECISGEVFDVIVDLRQESSTFGNHLEVVLGLSSAYIGLFVPSGCAHGYVTLEQDSTLIYFMDKEYSAENSKGIHWEDPKLQIQWPIKPTVISARDQSWPKFMEN